MPDGHSHPMRPKGPAIPPRQHDTDLRAPRHADRLTRGWVIPEQETPPPPPGPRPVDASTRMRVFVSDARRTWRDLTDDDLLDTNGYSHNLSWLIQERYGISREFAELQVKEFFEIHPLFR